MHLLVPVASCFCAHFTSTCGVFDRDSCRGMCLVRWRCLMLCALCTGTLWYAAAVGVVSLTKLYRANEDKKPLPVLLLAVVAASGARSHSNSNVAVNCPNSQTFPIQEVAPTWRLSCCKGWPHHLSKVCWAALEAANRGGHVSCHLRATLGGRVLRCLGVGAALQPTLCGRRRPLRGH